MRPRTPISTRTDTLFPYTTLFRALLQACGCRSGIGQRASVELPDQCRSLMVLERGCQSQMIEDADLPAIIGNIGSEPTDIDAPDKAPLVLCPAFLEIWRRGNAMRLQAVKIIGKQIALMVASVANRKRGRNDLVHIVRSEEHTSELQSLMRNSYAV